MLLKNACPKSTTGNTSTIDKPEKLGGPRHVQNAQRLSDAHQVTLRVLLQEEVLTPSLVIPAIAATQPGPMFAVSPMTGAEQAQKVGPLIT
jgi:hypothetical protein